MHTFTKKTFAFYWKHVRKHRTLFFLIAIAQIIGVLGETVLPIYYKQIVDILVEGAALSKDLLAGQMLDVVKIIALIFLGLFVVWRGSDFANNYFSNQIKKNILEDAFAYLNLHSYRFFSNSFAGSLVRRLYRLMGGFELLINNFLWNLLPITTRLISVTVILYFYSPLLSLVLMGWAVIFLIINVFLAKWQYPLDMDVNRADSKLGAFIADVITNQINVKLFTAEHHELLGFGEKSQVWYQKTKKSWDLGAKINLVQSLFMFGIELAILVLTIRLWQQGVVSAGFFMLVQTHLTGLFIHLWDFRFVIHNIFSAFADAEEMTKILNTPHEVRNRPDANLLHVRNADIRFNNVSFSYASGRPILNHFNLRIAPGEKIALVGHSGEGKSTICKLLLRFFDIQKGEILYDGQNIAHVTLESLRKAISLVPQEPILFHRSLLENIRYGKRGAPREDVIESSRLANCHEFISKLKDGYETKVGERGIKLSGGEKQRVAIARAVLENAPLVILDEATSSLDSHSEKLIQQALSRLMRGKTSIIIAHRLSTIMACDRIIVMKEGKILETGTHAELVKKETGAYRHLWEIQAGGFIQ